MLVLSHFKIKIQMKKHKTDFSNIELPFLKNGAIFKTSAEEIAVKLSNIKAFIFDWDGVFHNGAKSHNSNGTFSEIDAMGLNLMNYSFWLKNNQKLLVRGIISGAKQNPTAEYFAKRQHFSFIKLDVKRKDVALDKICEDFGIDYNQIAYTFDDANDISIAQKCGLRFFVKRNCNPIFNSYLEKSNYFDYATSHKGGNGAVREICELVMGLHQNADKVFADRAAFSDEYQKFWAERQKVETRII